LGLRYTRLVRVLLLATYELGRQPFGLASPAAWLRRAGFDVGVADTSRTPVADAELAGASVIAIHLQMHTATRLAGPLITRARRMSPSAHICCYGLYAPLNETWLRTMGVDTILGGEFEEALVQLARDVAGQARGSAPTLSVSASAFESRRGNPAWLPLPRLAFIQPDRSGLPPLHAYASVEMPDGSRRIAGSTDASRGCKHLCRHCPIVPVYNGQFRVVPADVVLADIRTQVAAGAQHISFGDPDFFNGPTHAMKIVERLAAEHPGVTYDVTIKVEHLIQHADLIPVLRATGCLFITSAVESVDDRVLEKLAKGHTRADFVRAVQLCREAGVALSPTFVPFTPWTTIDGYRDLLETIDGLDLIDHVASIQLGIRLLITARSALLELPDIKNGVDPFDAASLTWPWRHADPRVDALQRDVMRVVSEHKHGSRAETFDAIAVAAGAHVACASRRKTEMPVPMLNEPWYCCAEPDPEMGI
jgi:radical SAM superfamily enzyme YgiQ (UPF0313 family)